MRYNVRYDDFVVTTNTQNIEMDRCSSVMFENLGNDVLTLNKNVTMQPGEVRPYNNLPNEVIIKPFSVRFAGVGNAPLLLVQRKFVDNEATDEAGKKREHLDTNECNHSPKRRR